MFNVEYLVFLINTSKYADEIGFALILPLVFFLWYLSKILSWILTLILNKVCVRNRGFFYTYIKSSIKPISLLFVSYAFQILQKTYPFSKDLKHIFSYFNVLLFATAIIWLVNSVTSNLCAILRKKLIEQGSHSVAAVLPLLSKIVQIGFVIVGGLFVLKAWSFNVTAILATLGVGGIAIALAGQKTIENLLGGIILAVDQPIRVGDYGKFSNAIGTVIDLGLRSTKIQTADRTIVTIPNAVLSGDTIETYAYRDKILITHNIIVRHETTLDQLKTTIKKIEDVLSKNKKIEKETVLVKVNKFDIYGINIGLTAYALTSDSNEYSDIQQGVILSIIEIITENTSGFGTPFPSVRI